jgi:hypothetical protein
MATLASITLNDGQATPVAHTFTPLGPVGPDGTAILLDKSGGIAIGYNKLQFSLRAPINKVGAGQASGANRVYRARFKIDVPTMESTSAATGTGIPPAPTVAYVHAFDGTFTLPERGTAAERKNLRAYVRNFLADAVAQALVENQEGAW